MKNRSTLLSVAKSRPKLLRRAGLLTALALALSMIQLSVAPADTFPPNPADPTTPVTVSADPLPTVQIDGVAWTQRVIGDIVYVGGHFGTARPAGAAAGTSTTPRANLLAYTITTGVLISTWNVTTDGDVLSIVPSPDNAILYIGGTFTHVNGQVRNRIAAVTRATGQLVSTFHPSADATVRAIATAGATVYFGGVLTSVGGIARSRVAAVKATDGSLLPWAPNAQGGTVYALAVSPTANKVIMAGSFTSPGYGLASVHPTTGATLPLPANTLIRNAGANAAITSLSTDSDSFYASGYVFGAGGNLEGSARINWSDGAIKWVEDCHGDTYGTYPMGAVVYASSHNHYCRNLPDGFPETVPTIYHWATAFTKAPTGKLGHNQLGTYFDYGGTGSPSLLKWFPLLQNGTFTDQKQASWTVTGNSSYVVYGGEFPKAGGVAQQGLVRFAVTGNAPNKVGPQIVGSKFNPTVTSFTQGAARISWRANWDRDNEQLHYRVIRDGDIAHPIYETDQLSSEWSRPVMSFVDSGLVPGATRSYRVFATDHFGNEARSDTVTVVVSDTGTLSTYAQAVLGDHPSSYWRLGEASGTAIRDWAGVTDAIAAAGVTRGADGAIVGDANKASTFDGTTNGSATSPVKEVAPNVFSEEAWFKTTTTTGGKILGFGDALTGDSVTYDRHIYMSNDGRLTFGIDPRGIRTLSTLRAYNDGDWHHVVGSLGRQGMTFWVDGTLVGTRADTSYGRNYMGVWRIGGDLLAGSWPSPPSDGYFNGVVDEVAIYPSALTQAKVVNHYRTGRP